MSTLSVLQEKIVTLLPSAKIAVDPSETPTGSSWIDIYSGERNITIEYKPNFGFGLYQEEESEYGEGPAEIYRDQGALLRRISKVLVEHQVRQVKYGNVYH